jgi:transaldolase
LDGGNPEETRQIINLLVFLDGQTTNPALISRNPKAKHHLEQGKKFSEEVIINFHQEVVLKISVLIPLGAISIEVYSDPSTSAMQMLSKGKEMFSWIPNAHIKFSSLKEGLKAA